jgi:hypothetical protein
MPSNQTEAIIPAFFEFTTQFSTQFSSVSRLVDCRPHGNEFSALSRHHHRIHHLVLIFFRIALELPVTKNNYRQIHGISLSLSKHIGISHLPHSISPPMCWSSTNK